MWAFKTLWDKGLIYEGFRVLAYCWRCETPLSNTETRMDDVYRDRQDPALTVWFELETGERVLDVDHHAVDAAVQPGARRRARHRLRRDGGGRAALHPRRGAARRLRPRAGRRRAGRHDQGLASSSAAATGRCSSSSPTRRTRSRCSAGDFVSTEEGTGVVHMAPGFGEDDQIACNAVGIPTICPMDEHGRFTAPVIGLDRPARVRRQRRRDPAAQDRRRRRAPRLVQPLVPALLAVRPAARLPRDLVVVRRGDRVPRPDGRAQRADPLGARARQGRQLRQVARQRPRLVDQPQPLLGVADPGVGERSTRATRGSTCTARSPSSRPTSASRSPTSTGRRSTSWCAPTPTTRPAARRCAASPQVLDCWFESGSMPFAQVHYPFENAEWFEHHYPGDFIVEYIAQTRGWFYTLHVLATALFDRPAFSNCVSHGIVLGDDGLKMSKSLQQLPRPDGDVRHVRRRRDAVEPAVVADPARRRLRRHRDRHPRHRPPRHPADLEHVVLPDAVRQRGRHDAERSAPTRPTCSTATCSASSARSCDR